jgi:hypothetical protein
MRFRNLRTPVTVAVPMPSSTDQTCCMICTREHLPRRRRQEHEEVELAGARRPAR